jgi:D-lyxose ketol-isomerase
MKRSVINQKISEALLFFKEKQFKLPPWGYWSVSQWKQHRKNCEEIFTNGLGWDLTDFGSGDYSKSGLLLFTLRNGNLKEDRKSYAEKIMMVEEGQLTPMHFHLSKMEDIINRGGGNLIFQLYPSDPTGGFAAHEFEISLDGIRKNIQAGTELKLEPGESITLYQKLYHSFYGEKGCGKVLVGEVSSVNDDHTDNHFFQPVGRFPTIEEDEAPTHLLVSDYASFI